MSSVRLVAQQVEQAAGFTGLVDFRPGAVALGQAVGDVVLVTPGADGIEGGPVAGQHGEI